jgi:hypothetical protein
VRQSWRDWRAWHTFASTALAARCSRTWLPAFCGRSSITVMMDVHDRLFEAAGRRLPPPDGYIGSST